MPALNPHPNERRITARLGQGRLLRPHRQLLSLRSVQRAPGLVKLDPGLCRLIDTPRTDPGPTRLDADATLKLNGRSFKIVKLLGEGGFSYVSRVSPRLDRSSDVVRRPTQDHDTTQLPSCHRTSTDLRLHSCTRIGPWWLACGGLARVACPHRFVHLAGAPQVRPLTSHRTLSRVGLATRLRRCTSPKIWPRVDCSRSRRSGVRSGRTACARL